MISTVYLDKLAKYVLEQDTLNVFELQTKNATGDHPRTNSSQYRPEDIEAVCQILADDHHSLEDIHILANLALWNFRNSGGVLRSAFGLIGTALSPSFQSAIPRKEPLKARTTANIVESFLNESFWDIQNLTRASVATGACAAKIPFREYGAEIECLSNVRSAAPTVISLEKARLERLLKPVPVGMQTSENLDRMDYMVKRLIQILRAVNEYKQDDNFSQLRGFLNNAGHISTMIRIMVSDNPELMRLASDVNQQVNCTDRLLSSNAVAAGGLNARLQKGELVYSEILDLCNHQHRLMAVEAEATIAIFSYLLKKCSAQIQASSDLMRLVSRMIRFAGIAATYTTAIHSESYTSDF